MYMHAHGALATPTFFGIWGRSLVFKWSAPSFCFRVAMQRVMETRPRSSRQKSAKGRSRKISDPELQDLARNPASLSAMASSYEALSRSAVGFSDASKIVARDSSRQAWAPPAKQNLASSSARFHSNTPLPQNPTLPAHPPPRAFGRVSCTSSRSYTC